MDTFNGAADLIEARRRVALGRPACTSNHGQRRRKCVVTRKYVHFETGLSNSREYFILYLSRVCVFLAFASLRTMGNANCSVTLYSAIAGFHLSMAWQVVMPRTVR
jgi:hypothetical protein